MPKVIKLRKHLSDDTESYDRDDIEKYVEYLEEIGRLIKINNVFFDAKMMMKPFVCDTAQCIPAKKGRLLGKKRKRCSCCADYSPRMSAPEKKRIERILPKVKKRFPILEERIQEAGGYYHWDDGFDRMLSKDKKELCVFLTPDTSTFGFHACMLHAWALETGHPTGTCKPSACVMFPLFLLDVDTDLETMLVTFHNKEVMELGEDEDNFVKVGCIRKNTLKRKPIYVEMKDTIVYMFGEDVWKRLDREIRKSPWWVDEGE